MCILCVIQKWSRKVATMLPWLVIPLIGLWLLSQFLPPAFRFEITSPRLACVLVLLATLFWYEILMPQLSSWRARRNARLKEKKRLEAIEMQKLRKTATRRCRNCRTPYRDQNPSGGKFMCSYCGHLSKRPLFDSTVSPGLERFPNSGVLKDLIGKVWSDNNWTCGQDWIENGGSWVSGSLSGKPSYRKKHSGGFFNSGNDHLFSFLLVFVCKSFAAVFLGIMWLFRKIFRISFSEDDTSSDTDINGLDKKGENGVNCNETKSEKARRKAEEKRQARLEREQLEEEERKQREEVARLVEERRKLRDESDKNNKKDKTSLRDKNDKKGERKRQDRKKEKDRGSSKSNSDVDELEKRASKEIERKLKGATDYRETHKSKAVIANDHNKGSIGARYLERMRGNFFPSSRTITGVGFFGKGTNANASNTREHRSSAYLDHSGKKDFVQPERSYGKSNAQAVEQNQNRPVIFESQPCPPPKRSWQQLFTRSSPTVSSKTTNVISRPNANPQTESQSSIPSGYPVTQGFDNPISYGLPYSLSKFSHGNSNPTELLSKEPDNYEDPCYVPDPASLIGPVSESLDNFQLDLGFVPDVGFEKPSPIESPISRYEKNPDSFVFPSTRRTEEKTSLPLENHDEKGWQMWNSSPICSDTLGLVGASRTWYLPPELNGLKNEEKAHFQPQNTTVTIDDPWALRTSYGSLNNELVYGIPNGSAINHPFHMHHDNVCAKKENDAAAAAVVEGIGYTPPQMYSHFGHVNEKEKKETL